MDEDGCSSRGDADAVAMACELAGQKALHVSRRHPGRLCWAATRSVVRGRTSEQMPGHGGGPRTSARAVGQGAPADLPRPWRATADLLWTHASPCRMSMRTLSDKFLDSICRTEGQAILAWCGLLSFRRARARSFSIEWRAIIFRMLGLPLLPVLAELRKEGVLTAMSLTGTAKLAGIIGWPVTHSLSPGLHGYWLAEYRHRRRAWCRWRAPGGRFLGRDRGVMQAGFKGVNVTVPHKEAAFALAHKADGRPGRPAPPIC